MKISLKDIGSENLDFIGFAIDHGVESIKEGGPLVPFVIIKKDGKKDLQRFLSDTISDSVKRGEEYIQSIVPKPEIAVLVYDGTMNDGEKKDAILAKVWLDQKILIFAQPYRRDENGKILLLGDYLYVESN